jgi:MFS-type transporter involved in bile tolerance (Atg22 family)
VEVIKRLAKSRRFWLAVFACVQTIVMAYLNVKPEVWQSIAALVAVLIAAITVDDVTYNLGPK